MSTRILLVDDHEIVRDGLRSLIEKQAGMDVVGEADNGRVALKLARDLSPDIIIMDVSMPDLNGMEAARQILADHPRIKVIALSMHSDKGFVAGMLSAGAVGYILKKSAFEELVSAIRTVSSNQTYLSPQVAGVVREDYVRRLAGEQAPLAPTLSAREREVLQLIAEGATTKQIALRLHISEKTITWHRNRLMEKLKIHTIAELTKYAIRAGLTSLEG